MGSTTGPQAAGELYLALFKWEPLVSFGLQEAHAGSQPCGS